MQIKRKHEIDRPWIAGFLILLVLTAPSLRAEDSKRSVPANAAREAGDFSETASALYLKVRVPEFIKVSHLKPGQIIQGTLAQAVYSPTKELFPAGSKISMTVQGVQRRRRVPNDHWSWVVKAFTPRHENYPTFESGQMDMADGTQIPLQLSLVSISCEREVQAEAPKKRSSASSRAGSKQSTSESANAAVPGESPAPPSRKTMVAETKENALTFTLMATERSARNSGNASTDESLPSRSPASVAAVSVGERARIILLSQLAAQKATRATNFGRG